MDVLPQCFVYDGKRFMNLPAEEKGVFYTYAGRAVGEARELVQS